jgi:hypothetical protein
VRHTLTFSEIRQVSCSLVKSAIGWRWKKSSKSRSHAQLRHALD